MINWGKYTQIVFVWCIYIIASLLLGVLFLKPTTSLAQFNLRAPVTTQDISLEFTPEYPGPNETVSAVIDSFAINLNAREITWYINGERLLSEIGAREFSFQTSDIGTSLTLEVDIAVDIANTIKKTRRIAPSSVTLLAEPINVYVPPFYKGMPTIAPEAEFRITAIPNMIQGGTLLDRHELLYTWSQNFSRIPSRSGYARRSFETRNGLLNDVENISVEVATRDRSLVTQVQDKVKFYDPTVVLYQKKNTGDTPKINSAGLRSVSDRIQVQAEPYFFSWKGEGTLLPKWSSGTTNFQAENFVPPFTMTLNASGSREGVVQLEVEHLENLSQLQRGSTNIFFD